MENKVNIKALYLAVLATLFQNKQVDGLLGYNLVKPIFKHFKGVVTHTSKNKYGVIAPKHQTNSCWLNTGLGAFANCMDETVLDDVYSQIVDDVLDCVDAKKNSSEELVARNTLKHTRLLSGVINDILQLKSGQIHEFSENVKKSFGFEGQPGNPMTVVEKLNPELKLLGLEMKGFARSFVISLDETDIKRVLADSYTDRMTIFVQNIIRPTVLGYRIPLAGEMLSVFDHIYCLHVQKSANGELKYYLANDKGFGLNYSANIRELDKTEAESVIQKKAVGYLYIKEV